jgi:hypothetical protein
MNTTSVSGLQAERELAEGRTVYLHGDQVAEGLFICRCCDLFQPASHFRQHPKAAHIARYRSSLRLLGRLSKRGYVRGGSADSNLVSRAFRAARTRKPQPVPKLTPRLPWRRPMMEISRESSIERVLPRLRGVKPAGDGRWMACCPAHDDHNPSLSIRYTNGRVLLFDFAGCELGDIVVAIGLGVCDLFDAPMIVPARSVRQAIRDRGQPVPA